MTHLDGDHTRCVSCVEDCTCAFPFHFPMPVAGRCRFMTSLGLNFQDTEGTREEAEGLVSKYLLQDAGGGGYRVHDLVLDFVKIKIKGDEEIVGNATALHAQYLARPDVLQSYKNPEHGAGQQGLYVLDALWRSVEELSGDPGLEVASYRATLGELESCEATVEMAVSYSCVGDLFSLQVREIVLRSRTEGTSARRPRSEKSL